MIPSVESNQDRNTALFLLASLSPLVRESIDLELYRTSADSDGSSDKYVVEHAFTQMVKDLETIGIVLNFDYSELTETMEGLFGFIQFVSYLLPNSLYEMIKTNHAIRECIGHILSGSLGDNETLLQTYLTELGGLDNQLPLVPDLVEMIDSYYPQITQTETFSDYMRHVYDLAMTERLVVESDANQHQAYRDFTREHIGRLSDAVNHFSDHPLYEALCANLMRVIQDFTAPVNFTDYAYLFLTNKDTLPVDLTESFEQRGYHYRVGSSWCPDYFILRRTNPSDVQILMMYCYGYAQALNRESFKVLNRLLLLTYPSQEFTSPLLKLYEE